MQGVTVSEIAAAIALIAGIVGGLTTIFKLLSKYATKWLQANLQPINDKIDFQREASKKFHLGYYQDFLVEFMTDLEKGEHKSEVEMKNFHKNYDIYTSPEYCGNSFVHEKYEQLKKAGKV